MIDAEKFAKRQIKLITKKQKSSRKKYLVLAYLTSFLNLVVIVLAAIAIDLLLTDDHGLDIDLKLIMASLAAGTTIVIFILNIINIIYRSNMKWRIYQEAIEEIKFNIGKYRFGKGSENHISNIDLKLLSEEIYKKAIKTKRKSTFLKSTWKALSGGENA